MCGTGGRCPMRGHQSAPLWPRSTSLRPHGCGVLCPFRLPGKCALPCFSVMTLVFQEFRRSKIMTWLRSGSVFIFIKKEKRSEKLNSLSIGDNRLQGQLPGEWKPLLDGGEKKKNNKQTTTTIELNSWI